MLSIWAGVIVKGNIGLFLEVFWFYGIADFGFGIFPGDREGETWKKVVDNYKGVSAVNLVCSFEEFTRGDDFGTTESVARQKQSYDLDDI